MIIDADHNSHHVLSVIMLGTMLRHLHIFLIYSDIYLRVTTIIRLILRMRKLRRGDVR